MTTDAAESGKERQMPPKIDIDHLFTYHAPRPDQIPRYNAIREAARAFGHVLLANTPPSADQTAAVRLLREAVMTANAAIALEPPPA